MKLLLKVSLFCLLGLSLCCLLVSTYLYRHRKQIIEPYLTQKIEQALHTPVKLQFVTLNFHSIIIDLTIPQWDLDFKKINLSWTIKEILLNRYSLNGEMNYSKAPYKIKSEFEILHNIDSLEIKLKINSYEDHIFKTTLPIYIFAKTTDQNLSQAKYSVSAQLMSQKSLGESILNLNGDYDFKTSAGTLLLNGDLAFGSNLDRPDELTPHLNDILKKITGHLRIKSKLTLIKNSPFIFPMLVSGENLSFEVAGVPIQGLSAQIDFASLSPLISKPKQIIEIQKIGNDLPIENSTFHIEFTKNQKLKIAKSELKWAQGIIASPDFILDLKNNSFATSIFVSGLNLTDLLKTSGSDKIQATGTISGKVPLSFRNGFLSIQHGVLSNDLKKGWIQYKEAPPEGIPDKINYLDEFERLLSHGQQALVLKALNNFNFTSLTLILNRSPKNGLEPDIALVGSNPDLGKGMPFSFKISLTGQIEQALESLLRNSFVNSDSFNENNIKR